MPEEVVTSSGYLFNRSSLNWRYRQRQRYSHSANVRYTAVPEGYCFRHGQNPAPKQLRHPAQQRLHTMREADPNHRGRSPHQRVERLYFPLSPVEYVRWLPMAMPLLADDAARHPATVLAAHRQHGGELSQRILLIIGNTQHALTRQQRPGVAFTRRPRSNRCVPACASSPYCVHNACNSGRFAAHSRSAFSG